MPSEPEEVTQEQIEAAEAQIVEQSKRIEFYISEYSVELLAQKMRDGDYVEAYSGHPVKMQSDYR